MKSARSLATAAVALLVLGCEAGVRSPAAPPTFDFQNKPWDGVLPSPGTGTTSPEQFQVCKYGSSATFAYSATDNATGAVSNATITVQDGECWVLAVFGGAGATVSITETSAASGYAFDHADVTASTGPNSNPTLVTTTTTNATVTGVIGGSTVGLKGLTVKYYNVALPPAGEIGDFVWSDLNGNGVQDAGEPGLPGITVTLGGAASASTTTDVNGAYLFSGLGAGSYTVTVVTPAGYTASPTGAGTAATDNNGSPASVTLAAYNSSDLTIDFGFVPPALNACVAGPTGVNLGGLTNWLFIFTDGRTDANWQGATKGFAGNVGIDGILASERTSGGVPYAGTIYTNDATLGAWANIVNQAGNAGQAFGSTGNAALINSLRADLLNAMGQINALPVTAGYASRAATSLNGLNTQNGVPETFVINVTSGFQVSSKINITGDPGDFFILRWDTDASFGNGYQGQVKFQSGGAIVPLGGLTAANFVHVAGDINASGGGSNPAAPYPQGPRLNNGTGPLINGGANWNGGGFFTGYWLTTGAPATGQTASLSNAIFVGGWYSTTTKFSMTSGTSGVHVVCP